MCRVQFLSDLEQCTELMVTGSPGSQEGQRSCLDAASAQIAILEKQ